MSLNVVDKVYSGKRLGFDDVLSLYKNNDLLQLASLARTVKKEKTGGQVFFNVNRHINLTNICKSGCGLCAFACDREDSRGFLLNRQQVVEIVKAAKQQSPELTEIHIVSALHPDKGFDYYLDIVQAVKETAPDVHLKAFTPVEIVHFSNLTGLTTRQILERLKFAGLDSLPGGGAEILDDEVRKIICPNKASAKEWIEAIITAHELGILTNATMLYGHIETIEQRINHLLTLRDIQDKTQGFQAFVSFPFHPDNTRFPHLKRVSSWEDLKMIALARLVLDNFDHIKAFWMMLTLPVAQLSLAFGVDDLDGTVVEEKIIHAAGAKTQTGIVKEDIVNLIKETGFIPVERDTFYQPVRIY